MSIDKDVKKAVQVLKKGGVVVYPTDTAYGLGASCDSFKALEKIFKIKGRPRGKPISIIVSTLKQAKQIVVFNAKAENLWQKFMPGALTLVLPLKPEFKKQKNWKVLSGGTGTIGIRFPDEPLCRKMPRILGSPITTTSANIAGAPNCYSVKEVEAQFKVSKFKPDLILDGGKLRPGKISTVVELNGSEIKILRQGSISEKKILNA